MEGAGSPSAGGAAAGTNEEQKPKKEGKGMQHIIEKRGHRILPFLALAAAMVVLVLLAGNAAAAPTGPFEIDTFPVDSSTSPPTPLPANALKSYYSGNGDLDGGAGKADDWAQGASNNGVFLPSASAPHTATPNGPCYGSNIDLNPAISYIARFICDGFTGLSGAPELNIVSPAGDIPQDIWPVTTSNHLTPKDDLSHGYFAQLIQDCSGTPHNIIVVGMERGNNEGDNHWGIELDAVAPTGLETVADNVSPAANFALDFNRQVGDVYIAVDLSKGGVKPNILVTQISGFLANGNATFNQASATATCAAFAANTTSTNLVEQTAAPWNTPVCDPTTTDNGPNSCRIANGAGTGPVDQGSGSCKTATKPSVKQACTTVPARDFVEVAIDLTAYGISRGCFADVLLATVSSGAGSATPPAVDLSGADIKDITASFLPKCDLTILKRDADTGQLIGPFTATVSPNPFACKNPNPFPGSPLTVTDNVAPDDNSSLGTIHLSDVCPGSYTSNETVAPPGYSLDPNGSNPATCSVAPGTSTSCTFTFEDPLGTLTILKQDDQGNPQGGATFSITPNVFACHQPPGTDPSPITDGGAGDPDGLANGTITLTRVCIPNTVGNVYTVTETAAPPGFAKPATTSQTCEISENTVPDQQCSVTFQNRLGTIEWEKRSDIDGSLQGGATFSVGTAGGSDGDGNGPFACQDSNNTGADDNNPVTVVDNSPPDANPADGQFHLDRVCLGTYVITETAAPTGFAKDPNPTRTVTVSESELNPVVGTQGTADDCPDGGDADTNESDFCNLVGSLSWEKRGKDASTPATGDELLPGFDFSVTGTGVNFSNVTDCTSGPCPAGAGLDQDPDAGQFCLDTMPIGVLLTIDETSTVTGYIQTSPANNGDLTATLTSSTKCSGTPTDAGDFINEPLSKFEIKFICVAHSPSGSGECATQAKISCPAPAINPTPDDLTPAAFDDTDEIYGDGTTTLLPGTYNCTVEIDP